MAIPRKPQISDQSPKEKKIIMDHTDRSPRSWYTQRANKKKSRMGKKQIIANFMLE